MSGYMHRSATDFSKTSYAGLLYCKTNIGGYFFDGFLDVDHNYEVEITQNQIETGAMIVDHAYIKPITLSMQIIVSDVHQSIVNGQFSEGWSRHTSAWQILRKLQADRVPLSVFTKLALYDNMLIKSLSAKDTDKTLSTLVANVTLQEVPMATLKTVKISAADQTVLDSEIGKVNAQYLTNSDWSTLALLMGRDSSGETPQ